MNGIILEDCGKKRPRKKSMKMADFQKRDGGENPEQWHATSILCVKAEGEEIAVGFCGFSWN
jgi:hypothetical protein